MGTHRRERENYVRHFVMVEQGSFRRQVEAAIERLIDLLDRLDVDPDLEPDNDNEPSLAAPETEVPSSFRWVAERSHYGSQAAWSEGGLLDCEDDPAELGIADRGGLAEQLGREAGSN